MTRPSTIIILSLMCLLPLTAGGTAHRQYSPLVEFADDKPSEEIMRMAGKYAGQGKDAEAIVLYTVVADRFRSDLDDRGKNNCALALREIGDIYYKRGDYVNALDCFVKGVKLSEQCARPVHAANIYNYIGNVYCLFLDYEKGISYYLKACELCRKYPDTETEHDAQVNLTGIYTFLNDMPNAKKYYRLSEETKDTASHDDVFMSGYTHSLIQVCEGRYAQAIARLKKLAAYAEDKGMEPRYQCFAYQEIYGAYSKAGNADSTLKYMLLCDAAAGRYNLRHSFLTTLKCLSKFYENNGDIQKSNAYKSYYLNIMDSIYDSRAFDMVKNSLFTYEVGKTTKEIQDLKTREREKLHTIRKQRIVMWAVAAVALATAVFLAIVLRQRRRLNHSYSDLYKINRDFIVEQEQLTSRLRRDSEILKERDACIAALREQLGKAQAAEPQQAAPQEKYRTSSLTEEQSQALAEAIRNVMENTTEFCNSDFSLASLAELVGTNSKYVSQVINDVFHKSFNDYVNPYRIHLACARFADKENYGNFTMKAISESVGFKSYTSFVNIFKKVTGITPSFYFKMAARGNR